jgi:hypothetical protein
MTWLAMIALVLWAISYAGLCWAKPFAPCRKCHGESEVQRFGKPRLCPRCHGDKLRLRVGRRAHNYWRRTREAGAR